MSALSYHAASAANLVEGVAEITTDVLRHHLYQALMLADELKMHALSASVCELLRSLDP